MKLAYLSILMLFGLTTSVNLTAQYTINNVYANLTDCDTMTRGGFIAWWDNSYNMSADVTILLDSLESYRNDCLTNLGMMDPPNPIAGYYYNIYVTNSGDIFSGNGWAQGQGTDINGYPYLTLPDLNSLNPVAHEIFHVFQYNATSPGFSYSGDSQWYIEAAANWFAGKVNHNQPRAYIEAESLVRLPHVPLWLSYGNMPNSYPNNWQRYVHQYALALFLYYLTDEAGVSPNIIAGGLYAGTTQSPQEYFFNQVGGSLFRSHFINWAAHMTNEFDFISNTKRVYNLAEWNQYADLQDDNEFTETYTNTGSNGWIRPSDEDITNAWSFNTFKVKNNINQVYRFDLKGDAVGSYNDSAYFDGRIVIKGSGGTTIHPLNMTNNLDGNLTLSLSSTDTAAFFIIGSMPEIFEDPNPTFQQFGYEMQISTGIANINTPDLTIQKIELARYNLLGQRITKDYIGAQIILFNDGTKKKIMNQNNH